MTTQIKEKGCWKVDRCIAQFVMNLQEHVLYFSVLPINASDFTFQLLPANFVCTLDYYVYLVGEPTLIH